MAAYNAERMRIARYAKESITIELIARRISKRYGLAYEEIQKRGRSNIRSEVRKVCAFICNRHYHFPIIQIVRYFNISSPSVSNMVEEGERLVKDSKTLSY